MIQSITGFFVSLFNRWMPDAFVVAVILTIFTAIMAVLAADFSPSDTVLSWGDSIWNLLRFTNQVVLTLLFGHAVAHTPLVHKGLGMLAGKVHSAKVAYSLACFITGVCALLSWGLSLIVGGILARSIGERCKKEGIIIHYPLLVAASYSGFVLFHQGLSGTIPLTIATPDHFLESTMGIVPFSETVFSSWSMSLAAIILITLPVVMTRLRPADDECEPLSDALLAHSEAVEAAADLKALEDPHEAPTPASKLDHWRPLNWVLIAAGLYYLGTHFFVREQGLNLDILNFAFLMLGLGLICCNTRSTQALRGSCWHRVWRKWLSMFSSIIPMPTLCRLPPLSAPRFLIYSSQLVAANGPYRGLS